MGDEVRRGRQTPTQSVVLPYKETKGQEAVDLYNRTGRTAQEWQVLQLYDILALDAEGRWCHMKYGYSVPRRNGKNEIAAIRELYGILHGEHILHTAHRTATSHSAWERLCDLLNKLGYEEIIRPKQGETYEKGYTSFKQYGLESVKMLNGEGVVNFRPVFEPIFEPDTAMLSGIGDAAIKINQAIPGFFDAKSLRDITGIEPSTSAE